VASISWLGSLRRVQVGRKPWLEPTTHRLYSRLLSRTLQGDDVAIKLPPRKLPLRLRRGRLAALQRRREDIVERVRWRYVRWRLSVLRRRYLARRGLRIERTYDAPAHAVFDAWTSEEVLRRWFHGQPYWETPEAEVDLRVGGAVRVVMRDPYKNAEYGGGGRYTEIDSPNRLAFTWKWDDYGTTALIELDFEEVDGVTTVRFKHSGLWDEEALRSHGWHACFDNLERALQAARAGG
jgi:uncharacterized protein YndB with AHSA1/START domain